MPNRDDQMRDAAQAFMLVLNFIGTILLFTGAGWLIDWWQGTTPTFILIGAAVGFAGGIYGFFRAAIRLGKPKRGQTAAEHDPAPRDKDANPR